MTVPEDWVDLVGALLRGTSYFGPALRAGVGRPPNASAFGVVLEHVTDRDPIHIVEVGSWVGQSAITWIHAGNRLGMNVVVHMVDPWLPYHAESGQTDPGALEMDDWLERGLIMDLLRHNLSAEGVATNVRIHRGTLAQKGSELPWDNVAVLYIDGSHAYEDVARDIELSLSRLPTGAVLCGDDLEWQIRGDEIEEIRRMVAIQSDYVRSSRFGGFHPGVSLAVYELLGHVDTLGAFWWHLIAEERRSRVSQ